MTKVEPLLGYTGPKKRTRKEADANVRYFTNVSLNGGATVPKRKAGETIPNQVFVGCPYRTVRPKYVHAIEKQRKKYPLSFVIVGRGDRQDAANLLSTIKERLLSSSYAVFDASGGNANVSLEFGLAEAHDIPRAIYLCTHGSVRAKTSSDAPIIADLAGKKRNQYKQEPQLVKLLGEMCRDHNYTKRFERFMRDSFRNASKGTKKRARALALKVVHALDGPGVRRRADIVQALLADTVRYDEEEIDKMIIRLHTSKLVLSKQGPYSTVSVR